MYRTSRTNGAAKSGSYPAMAKSRSAHLTKKAIISKESSLRHIRIHRKAHPANRIPFLKANATSYPNTQAIPPQFYLLNQLKDCALLHPLLCGWIVATIFEKIVVCYAHMCDTGLLQSLYPVEPPMART
jgi:hypothetical protein